MQKNPSETISNALKKATKLKQIAVDRPVQESHGDYTTNIAIKQGLPAGEIKEKLSKDKSLHHIVSKIDVIPPGFINFFLSQETLLNNLQTVLDMSKDYGKGDYLRNKKIIVEYAHPNTHKELHIGHMRTLVLGEALARLFETQGADVLRANYQGDIGPHVAKAIWGTMRILDERDLSWDSAENLSLSEKAHLLGEGYVRGNQEYDSNKAEIDTINIQIYSRDGQIMPIYERTRRWSLDYYDTFYSRFGTVFDKLYFESEMSEAGKKLVLDNLNNVFQKSEGAVIFDGEKYGLHKRVFITKDGYPTYEGKDMALAFAQYRDFPFDKIIHVVANEQTEYFKVVFKALSELDSKFAVSQYHLPMGMVELVGMKMSSRTGAIVTVEDLIDKVSQKVIELSPDTDAEQIVLAAIKYAFLKSHPESKVSFDVAQSVDINGNSGPYLQYTYARTQSVLRKAPNFKAYQSSVISHRSSEELALLRSFVQYQGVLSDAAKNYSPNLLCSYLYSLAQKYNTFYATHRILDASNKSSVTSQFRLALTAATGIILKNGLYLLGITAPDRM